jgi:hypothetical protein
MDPNAALAIVRAALDDMPEEAAEAFRGLDEWLSRGGFLPEAWERPLASRSWAEDDEDFAARMEWGDNQRAMARLEGRELTAADLDRMWAEAQGQGGADDLPEEAS